MTNLTDLFPAVPTYTPAMMQFDGSTGNYRTTTFTSAGNKVTAIIRFSRSSFTGNTKEYMMRSEVGAALERFVCISRSSDYSTTEYADKIHVTVENSGGTQICNFLTEAGWLDGEPHIIFFAFDGDAGTAIFKIDGIDAEDTGFSARVAPTIGTLPSGANTTVELGAADGATDWYGGNLGFFGYREAYLTNWSDFMYADGSPRPLDQIGWTQWNGGTFQTPMMTFDGSTGYYSKTGVTTSGHKVSMVAQIKRASFTGDTYEVIGLVGNTYTRCQIIVISSNHSSLTNRQAKIQCDVQNSAGAGVCKIISSVTVLDDEQHTIRFQFDGDVGTASLVIDGVEVDDTGNPDRVAPVTATLETGAGFACAVGASTSGTLHFEGGIGFFGCRDSLTNWSDFMQADGQPKEIDEIGWQQWGGQPLFWNRGGLMTDNAGSAGAMTKNGTITGPSGGWPSFWNEHGQMSNNLGSAGDMTENGLIVVGDSGN